MKLSLFGRLGMALFASLALLLGMTACGGGTIAYMWVLGQQYNQIAGFKVDDYTGNLTQIIESPFSSNGAVPVSIVVKTGGRYVYVINQGTCPTAGCGTGPNSGQNIALFSVGGDGVLTFQEQYASQGYDSQWAQMDSSGTYLFVLDKYSPSLITTGSNAGKYLGPNSDGKGSITVFNADPSTGRLTLVTNSQTLSGGVNVPFWEVGGAPFMMKTSGTCLYTVNGTNNTVTPYSVGTGGQLVFTTTGTITTPAGDITSINGGGSYIFLTDAANNEVDEYSTTAGCNLTSVGSGVTPNFTGTSNPTYSFLDGTGKFLYVLNSSTTNTLPTNPYSSISAWTIVQSNQDLQQNPDGAPFTVGAGPVCMVEDPTNQYVYISNHDAGTVTGKVLNQQNGDLSDLSRGSTFATVGQPGCLALSGAVD